MHRQPPDRVELDVLGTVNVRRSGLEVRPVVLQPKRFALLTYLSLATTQGFHRRDTLLALFWPELDTSHARQALNQAVHFLRHHLGREVLVSRGSEEIGIAPGRLRCDAIEFREALDRDAPADALALYRGDLLPGFFVPDAAEFERWLERERERLRTLASEAAARLSKLEEERSDLRAAIRWATVGLELAPFNETALRRLVGLLQRAGDRAAALRVGATFARRLEVELGAPVSEETDAVVRGLRAEESPRDLPRGDASSATEDSAADDATTTEADASGSLRDGRPNRLSITAEQLAVGVALALALCVAIIVAEDRFSQAGRPAADARPVEAAAPLLAVLPIVGPPEDDGFADVLTEAVAARLVTLESFRVMARVPAPLYEELENGPESIGAQLGADYVLQSKVRLEPPDDVTSIRFATKLVRVSDAMHLWVGVYERLLTDHFRLASDLADWLVQELEFAMTESQPAAP